MIISSSRWKEKYTVVFAGEIFQKTAKGQSEMKSRSGALSMRDRRVLILVNGERSARQIKDQALLENIIEILENLEKKGYIARHSASPQTEEINRVEIEA